ncbi:MAG: DDE-type integrase/transposase/recombinase [Candidatus Aenigmarchaeota archaeon]|nr:DDE-type integrase/transposase/recombinase [Candidatus Aenigmarchaeota archaeon]
MLVCVYCQSNEVLRNGSRKTISGDRQRFICKSCKKTFVENNLLKKFKGKPETLTLVLDLYFKGLSLRKIQDHLKQFYNLKIHYSTNYRWIIRFVKIMGNYTRKLQPKLSGIWHADEQMIKSKGRYIWSWNLLDSETRFLIANVVTEGREIKDAKKLFKKSKEIAQNPELIITDGLFSYERAIKKEFSVWRLPRTEHIRLPTIRDKINNNLIEKFHGSIRERDKVLRGFKEDYAAQNILNGFSIYYNFIRPHIGLNGFTPAQISNVNLPLNEGNRWLELLKLSLENRNGYSNGNIQKPNPAKRIRSYILKVYSKDGIKLNPKEERFKSQFKNYDILVINLN